MSNFDEFETTSFWTKNFSFCKPQIFIEKIHPNCRPTTMTTTICNANYCSAATTQPIFGLRPVHLAPLDPQKFDKKCFKCNFWHLLFCIKKFWAILSHFLIKDSIDQLQILRCIHTEHITRHNTHETWPFQCSRICFCTQTTIFCRVICHGVNATVALIILCLTTAYCCKRLLLIEPTNLLRRSCLGFDYKTLKSM